MTRRVHNDHHNHGEGSNSTRLHSPRSDVNHGESVTKVVLTSIIGEPVRP